MILKNTSTSTVIFFDRRSRQHSLGAGQAIELRDNLVGALPQCVVRVVETPAVTGETTEHVEVTTTETTTTVQKKRRRKATTEATTEQE